jgi:hypothetical protein
LLIEDLAKKDIDYFLRQRLVACDAGRNTGEMVPEIAKDGFQIRGWNEVLALKKTDILDALTVSWNIR